MEKLILNETEIKIDEFGRYSLTDLWKASGLGKEKKPVHFIRMNAAKELISVISENYNFNVVLTVKGRYNGGTFAVKEVALKYIAWLDVRLEAQFLSEQSFDDGLYKLERMTEEVNRERLVVTSNRCEEGALASIEQLLGINLIRQYKVGKYRIDGYHKESNTAYEIDEPQHFCNGSLKEECKKRQIDIEKAIGCKFVRIKI